MKRKFDEPYLWVLKSKGQLLNWQFDIIGQQSAFGLKPKNLYLLYALRHRPWSYYTRFLFNIIIIDWLGISL